jgi:hypothetical protein
MVLYMKFAMMDLMHRGHMRLVPQPTLPFQDQVSQLHARRSFNGAS